MSSLNAIESLNRMFAETLISKMSKTFDEIAIEGLKRKGFEFQDNSELESFVKENCSVIDNIEHKERIYSVHGKPFLLHRYEVVYDLENRGNLLTANYGYYCFL
ncbi:hypothetical protein ACI6PS_02600 [Flavobacterium sp. PLA-1-15]|uniref:hypothetical protein n=1 Tax=Flavobacterium sp. PLA-1-15 TaxID=3380533 RepID=UPI003B7A4E34